MMVFLFRPKLGPDSLHIGPLAKAPRLRVGLILGSGTLPRLVLIAQEQVRLIFRALRRFEVEPRLGITN